ncbi:MAG: Fe-S protein assembly co-chaperone HscB [Alphaproteobacteria bacterium]|nr:Fe-S protein assembly co-chaperone HscB [Alphaproteobacteria bacterium]
MRNLSLQEQCWSCKDVIKITALLCPTCHKIQPLREMNEFQRLDLETSFELDLVHLEKQYFQLQRKLHPDNFVGASALEKDFSRLHSAAVNHSYIILKDPLKRAECFLQIQGFSLSDKNIGLEDANLLMEIMEMREAIDVASSSNALAQVLNHARDIFEKGLEDLSHYFVQKVYAHAVKELQHLKYINNIMQECCVQLKKFA